MLTCLNLSSKIVNYYFCNTFHIFLNTEISIISLTKGIFFFFFFFFFLFVFFSVFLFKCKLTICLVFVWPRFFSLPLFKNMWNDGNVLLLMNTSMFCLGKIPSSQIVGTQNCGTSPLWKSGWKISELHCEWHTYNTNPVNLLDLIHIPSGLEAMARSGLHDSCTPARFWTGSVCQTMSARTNSDLDWFCTIWSGLPVEECNRIWKWETCSRPVTFCLTCA